MHAVVARVTIAERESAESHLREQVVPGVSQAPGFVRGYWTYKDGTGVAMVVFESEEAANGSRESPVDAPRRRRPAGHRGPRGRGARLILVFCSPRDTAWAMSAKDVEAAEASESTPLLSRCVRRASKHRGR